MAMHTGEAELRDGDYYGVTVNRCARLRAVAHGGQVLLSRATADLVRDSLPGDATLHDLGEHRLRDLARMERIWQLCAPGLPAEFPPLRSLDALPNNLPVQVTSFVGRGREMAEVRRLLAGARLLTLTGAGGAGKTRLALQVAADVLDAYPDGVWLVELASLADPALVAQAVATALGVREEPGRPLTATLADAVKARRLLLVLDNCEHLITACATLVDALIHAGPALRVLATSREVLAIAGETVYRVPPLELGDGPHPPTPSPNVGRGGDLSNPPTEGSPPPALGEGSGVRAVSEAEQLFVERAQAVQPAFTLTAENAAAIAQICRRLDGLPLALELAAARVSVLSVEQIAARLDDRFRLLTGGSRTALPRQQTLRAAIDWSYDLLTEPERAVLRRLSVFAGGWTLEAAEAVCSDEAVEAYAVLDLLNQLVDKSLVVVEEQDGEARYRLLETIRQYGEGKLEEAGERAVIRARHRDWYLALAERAEPALRGPEQLRWLRRLDAEHDNLRAALTWSLSDDSDPVPGLRLAVALAWFWELRGHYGEGRRWLGSLLRRAEATGVSVSLRAAALSAAGSLARFQGDLTAARFPLEESAALFRELGDARRLAYALHWLGPTLLDLGEREAVPDLYEECLALFGEAGDEWGYALALSSRVGLSLPMGSPTARADAEESLATFRRLGDTWGVTRALNFLGREALTRRDYDRAAAAFEECLTLSRLLGSTRFVMVALHHLGYALLIRAKHRQAIARFADAITLAREIGQTWAFANTLAGLAAVAVAVGQPGRAATLLGGAAALRERAGAEPPETYRDVEDRAAAAMRTKLGEEAFLAAWAEGRRMTAAEAMTYALAAAAAMQAGTQADDEERIARAYPDDLTEREVEVLRLLAAGLSNRQIADTLVISIRTAERHIANIYEKIGAHGVTARVTATNYAVRHGLAEASPP